MTIGPEIRAVPALGDKSAAVPAEGAGLIDMFGEIIAGMGAAPAAEALTSDPSDGTVESEVEAPEAAPSAAANVVQLLALTVRQQGKAQGEVPSSDEPAEADGATPVIEQDQVPEIAPAAQAPVPPQAVPMVAAQAVPAPQAVMTAGHQASIQPQPAPATGQSSPKSKLSAVAAALQPGPDQPADDSAPPQPAAAAGIADLLKSIARPSPLPHARNAAPDSVPQDKGQDPVATLPEVKHPAFAPAASASVSAPITSILAETTRSIELAPAAMEPIPEVEVTDFAIERQLDFAQEGEWLDSLAKDIARTAAGEGGALRFRLNPENLGSLRVEITQQANGSAVRLTADTEAARAIIAEAQPRLVAEARANGVRISETHVDLGGQGASGDPRRHNATSEEVPVRTARFLRDEEPSDGKPTRSQSERYA